MNKLHILTIILLIIYIYLIYLLYEYINKNYTINENFIDILDFMNDSIDKFKDPNKNLKDIIKYQPNKDKSKTETLNTDNVKKESDIRFIYLYHFKRSNYFVFYNKNYEDYIKIIPKINDYKKTINIEDIKNNIIGSLLTEKYNIYTYQIDIYLKKITIEFIEEYRSIKIYLEDGDKIFYIKHNKTINNDSYKIFLYEKLIGKIKYNDDNKMYKIMVFKEYKENLNLFGIGLVTIIINS